MLLSSPLLAKHRILEMEGTEPNIRERTKQQDGNQEADNALLMSSKPLHRFVRREPRTLGVTHQTIQGHNIRAGAHL